MIFRKDARMGWGVWLGLLAASATLAVSIALASRVHLGVDGPEGAWAHIALPLWCDPGIGEAVLFEGPDASGTQAVDVKVVRGVPGMRIDVGTDRMVSVGGVALGRAKTHGPSGRALEAIGPGTVPAGRFYLHDEDPDSYDSRYAEVGLAARERILGRAVALPGLPWLGLEGGAARRNDAGDYGHTVPGRRIPAQRSRW